MVKRYRPAGPVTRLLAIAGGSALLLVLLVSPGDTGAQPRDHSPPLSSTALFSRFAEVQGRVPPSFVQDAVRQESQPVAPAEALVAPSSVGGVDIKVNQDFSQRPQNETTIVVNPFSPNMIVGGANDYRLGNPVGAAFYTSFDNGSTWNDGIPPYPLLVAVKSGKEQVRETPFGTGDPVLAFGRAREGDPELLAGTPVVYLAYLGVSSSFCEHGIFVSRSSNGLTWTRPAVPPLLPPAGAFTPAYWDRYKDCSIFNDKPWLAVDTSGGPHDGRVYATWTRFRFKRQRFLESPIFMAYSDDNGVNWSTPMEVSGSSNALCSEQLHGGGRVDDDDDDDNDIRSSRRRRCDESHFSNTTVGPDGRLYIAFANQQFLGAKDGFRNQYLVTSVDPDTLAVSGPFRVAGMIDGNNDLPLNALDQPTLCNSNFRFNTFGNIALDPSDPTGKTLYVVFVDNRNGSPFPHPTRVAQEPPDSFFCPEGTTTDLDVFIMKSSDGGATWGSPVAGSAEPLRVNQDAFKNGRDQWFPFAAVAPDGRVDVMFYDRRDDFFNRLAHVYLARSTDRGVTWSETRVTDAPSNMNLAFENGFFMGDYNGLAIGPDGTSYPFWTDARRGTPRERQSDVMMDSVRP